MIYNIVLDRFKRLIVINSILRDRTKPPNAKSKSSANKPNVLATIMFLPAAPINLNNPAAD